MLNKTGTVRGRLETSESPLQISNSRLPQPAKSPVRSSPLKFFASSALKPNPPSRTQEDWQANYLNDLRFNRPARPSGSRPLPERERPRSFTPAQELPLRTSSAMSRPIRESESLNPSMPGRCSSAMSQRPVDTEKVRANVNNGAEDMIHHPNSPVGQRDIPIAMSNMVAPSASYRESGQRWMEKQEARSLREALEDMDLRDEGLLYEAAKQEASELVWKHRNPHAPYRNPNAPYDYKSHLRKGSHARSLTAGPYGNLGSQHDSRIPTRIPSSEKPTAGDTKAVDSASKSSPPQASINVAGSNDGHALWDSPQKRAYMSMTLPIAPWNRSGSRRSSGPKSRKTSSGLFRNPNDQIYEEPSELKIEAETVIDQFPGPLQVKPRNVIPSIQSAGQPPSRSATDPASFDGKISRFEIYKNPPSQSRNPSYVKNDVFPTSASSVGSNDKKILPDSPARNDGMEIRGDDIRAATSMRMRDRSPKLPSPTVVSDQRGRPIVSFDPHWKPRGHEDVQDDDKPASNVVHNAYNPRSVASAPVVPLINLPEPLPSMHKEKDSNILPEPMNPVKFSSSEIPSISVEDVQTTKRSLPNPNSGGSSKPIPRRILDSFAPRANLSARHWSQSPSIRRATAQCYACALPISGRIVSAASHRFHPQCFTCHHCSTLLEHVAFYPEPEDSRKARLARIQARATAVDHVDEIDGKTADDDGDDGLRFYCHLDFHEKFSPRCRNCKTPIEGEVVVACGGEWHVGHFFCAECGDPFDAKTPFVEREGYAWCVECHMKRFSGKCKGCKKPIVDLVVRALGGEWHEGCFCCKVGDDSIPPLQMLKWKRLTGWMFRSAEADSRMGDFSLEEMKRCRYV